MTSGESKAVQPYAHLTITKYIAAQIQLLRGQKSQREIAAEVGYEHPNMISMLKRGETRLPLDKIPAMAKALHVDVAHMYRLAMEDYWPNQKQALGQIFGRIVSDNEAEWLKEIRKLTGNKDLVMSSSIRKRLRDALEGLGE